MKHYCVTYYDGKGERQMYVQAKSINAAKAAANDLLRKNKTIGAAVRKAERVLSAEYHNGQDRLRLRQSGMSHLIGKHIELCEECKLAKAMQAKQTHSLPLNAKDINDIIKRRK